MRTLTQEQIKRHDKLYKRAWRLIEGATLLHEECAHGAPGWWTRRKLSGAIDLFGQVLELNPGSWQSMWALGKVYQRLGDDGTALDWFAKASEIEATNPDVPREASICAMNLGRATEAVRFAQLAVKAAPDDAGLVANLALSYLLAGDLNAAHAQGREAVEADAEDQVSRNALQVIESVISGQRACPRTLNEITRS